MKKKLNLEEKELKQNPIMIQIDSIKVILNYNELPGKQTPFDSRRINNCRLSRGQISREVVALEDRATKVE